MTRFLVLLSLTVLACFFSVFSAVHNMVELSLVAMVCMCFCAYMSYVVNREDSLSN